MMLFCEVAVKEKGYKNDGGKPCEPYVSVLNQDKVCPTNKY